MSVYVYSAFGLSIHTNMVCPEFPLHPHPAREPDVTIRLLADAAPSLCQQQEGACEMLPGQFQLEIPGLARYFVEEGKRIVIEPFPGAPPDRVRLFMMGFTMGALLYQRGLFPLHGSAVETEFGAMIFVGRSGSGKSTLAAEFHRRGYRPLSDEISAIQQTPQGLRVVPALSHFRLCADAYGRLGSPSAARFEVDKFVLPMGERFCPDPAPLKAIHVLSDHDADVPRFEVLHGFDRLRTLLENLYRPQYLKGQCTPTDAMQMTAMIAKEVVMAVVSRRRNGTTTADLVRFLESAWEENFKSASCREEN